MIHHLSASHKFVRMQLRINELELMRTEYIVLLNYLCVEHGVEGKFVVWNSKAQIIKLVPLKSEIKKTADGETYLEISRIEPNNIGHKPNE